ncbi:MAG TPA: hypothetical protein PK598_00980, partial [Thermoanaerobaculia bacterium]|nr:hypothetical protein [Thermoanaerobaculia bacterium]
DPYRERPRGESAPPPRSRLDLRELAEAAARARDEARTAAETLLAAIRREESRKEALGRLDVATLRDRLALAYALDGAISEVEEDPALWARVGEAVRDWLDRAGSLAGTACHEPAPEAVIPAADLRGRALLLIGAADLWSGDFAMILPAEGREQEALDAAWTSFGKGRGSEPLLARVESFEALRRIEEGRFGEAAVLASRAVETFVVSGHEADLARATLAAGLAEWGEGRRRPALTALRQAAKAFRGGEVWGGYVVATCAVALCLAAEGKIEDARRKFRDTRRRPLRKAPLELRLFFRETERIALLLERRPKKGQPPSVFNPPDVIRLRAADSLAKQILIAARAGGGELEASLRLSREYPSRSFALFSICQKGNLLVRQDPLRALELARRLYYEVLSPADETEAVRRAIGNSQETLQAEAKLLESQALNQLGYPSDARKAAADARALFAAGGGTGLGKVMADYFEGSAAIFAKEYAAGEKLLKKALRAVAAFDPPNLRARVEATLGTLYLHRGEERRGLPYLQHAIDTTDGAEDGQFLSAILSNQGAALSRLGRFDEARVSFSRALLVARRMNLRAQMSITRTGLAVSDLVRREFSRALKAFRQVADEARRERWMQQAFFADLYTAECLGQLGRDEEMASVIRNLREERREHFVVSPLALAELFACLDQGELNANLIAHVRAYLEDEANGIRREYRRFRVVG